jgi:hypothetical protein
MAVAAFRAKQLINFNYVHLIFLNTAENGA